MKFVLLNRFIDSEMLNSKTPAALKTVLGIALMLHCFILPSEAFAQKLSGQWIGGFSSSDDPRQSKTDYVLEIEVNGTQVSGYSYTYFSLSGKRYFVICKLKGTYDKGSKSLSVNETETVKTNTPPNFQNCHQSHLLTYFKKDDKETLVGKWKPNEKGSNCGKGETELERKLIQGLKSSQAEVVKSNPAPSKSSGSSLLKTPVSPLNSDTKGSSGNNKIQTPVEKKSDLSSDEHASPKPIQELATENKGATIVNERENEKLRSAAEAEKPKSTQRSYQVIKTIEVEDTEIRVEIYDNGQIDGDTVSLFLNEKVIVKKRMLTAKPISINIETNEKEDVYDLVMYAENLGKIPPNTALMIINTSKNRYEVNITSTEQTSGAVRFIIKR